MSRKMSILDGDEAAAAVAYRLNEVIAIYPITPSSPMCEWSDQWNPEHLGSYPSRHRNAERRRFHSACPDAFGRLATRKWISLVSVAPLGNEVGGGLLRLPLLRAKFCELIGKKIDMQRESNELFLMGLLSVMDAFLNVPMADVLTGIPVSENIKKALLGKPSPYRPVFEVVLDYESGTWEQLTHSAR